MQFRRCLRHPPKSRGAGGSRRHAVLRVGQRLRRGYMLGRVTGIRRLWHRGGQLLSRIKGLKLGNRSAIVEIKAFGSRAGSTFRGRGPTPQSDIAIFVRAHPSLLGSKQQNRVKERLAEIASEFEKDAGIKMQIVPSWELKPEPISEATIVGSGIPLN